MFNNNVPNPLADTYKEMLEGTKAEYEKFFNGALKKFKISSPADLKTDAEKKKFYDYVDKNYTSEDEENEELNLEDYSVGDWEEFMMSEDFEQLDELSKKTLSSYIGKSKSARDKGLKDYHKSPEGSDERDKVGKKLNKRTDGATKAQDKLRGRQNLKNAKENYDLKKKESNLEEAKNYTYDGSGTVKITKKNFAKVHKDYKGGTKGKETMMVLSPKTGGTVLAPVEFISEELEEATNWKQGDGKPKGGSSIENVKFWDLPDASLKYIQKDASAAMKANPEGKKAGKYADEVNDASTVLFWRKKNNIIVK
jgi:hypothetical protein